HDHGVDIQGGGVVVPAEGLRGLAVVEDVLDADSAEFDGGGVGDGIKVVDVGVGKVVDGLVAPQGLLLGHQGLGEGEAGADHQVGIDQLVHPVVGNLGEVLHSVAGGPQQRGA